MASVLELFESERLPAAVAQTVIARIGGDTVSSRWSLANQVLCLLAGTTDAAGFRQWEACGGRVRKGARAFYILGPITAKVREEDAETGEQSERVIVRGFKGIPVFRREDVDGLPPEPDYEPAELPPLFDVASELGVSVKWAPCAGDFRGAYLPGSREVLLCSHDVVTFFHELAHVAHERVVGKLQGGQHPGQEIVAELTAAVLCRLYDVEGFEAHSFEYVSHYAEKIGKTASVAAMRVLGDVQKVLGVILGLEEDAAAAAA